MWAKADTRITSSCLCQPGKVAIEQKAAEARVRPQLARKRIVDNRHDARIAFLVGPIKPLEGLVGIAAEGIYRRDLKRHVVAVAGDQCVQRRICGHRVTSSLLGQSHGVGAPIRIGFLRGGFQGRLAVPAFRLDQRQHFPRPRTARLEFDRLPGRLHGFVVTTERGQQPREIEVSVGGQRLQPNRLLQELDRFLDLAEISDDRREPDLRVRGSRSQLRGSSKFRLGTLWHSDRR